MHEVQRGLVFSHCGKSHMIALVSGKEVPILPQFGVLAPRFSRIHM